MENLNLLEIMKNLNLLEILKNTPKNIELYCSLIKCEEGNNTNVKLLYVNTFSKCITIGYSDSKILDINTDGSLRGYEGGECVLFPSKDNRDWNKFRIEKSVDDIIDNYILRKGIYNDDNPKLQAIIKMLAVADYLNGKWKLDWENSNQDKWHLNECGGAVITAYNSYDKTSFCYFKDSETAQKAMEMLGEEVIKTALS